MKITREDFGNEFMERFSEKHQQYIMDFCNTFQRTFPDILDKETIINRIARLKKIVPTQGNKSPNGQIDYSGYRISFKNGDMQTENYGGPIIEYKEGQSDKDEKNTFYHELLHLLSYHREQKGYNYLGLFANGEGKSIFDEIMNEFYTIQMLENEGIYSENEYVLKQPTLLSPSRESSKYHGNGYIGKVQLAELYHKIFGIDLLKAKLFQYEQFKEQFDQKYKGLDISKQQEVYDEEDMLSTYGCISMQMDEDTYGAYETAIDIWKINELEQVEENGFNLYSYLQYSQELMRYLPVREENGAYGTDRNNSGIPQEIFDKVSQMDRDFICQYLRTDLMQIQDENERNRKINTVLAVINILRENIQELTQQDIDTVSFSKISQYTHGGKDCLVINTASHDFMTFVNNSDEANYQFGAYSKFKQLPEFEDFGFTQEHEEQLRTTFREQGVELQEYQYATVMDSGQYGMYSLVKSNGKYYTATGEITEVQLDGTETLGTNPSQIEIATKICSVGLSEINDITKTLRQELEIARETPNIDERDD